VELLEPAGRRLRLTQAGRTRAEMDAYRTTPRGVVRVAMFASGAVMNATGIPASRELIRRPLRCVHAARRIEAVTRTGADTRTH
jgi:hypothetical protein